MIFPLLFVFAPFVLSGSIFNVPEADLFSISVRKDLGPLVLLVRPQGATMGKVEVYGTNFFFSLIFLGRGIEKWKSDLFLKSFF